MVCPGITDPPLFRGNFTRVPQIIPRLLDILFNPKVSHVFSHTVSGISFSACQFLLVLSDIQMLLHWNFFIHKDGAIFAVEGRVVAEIL